MANGYRSYRMNSPVFDFDTPEIPILLMEDLRRLDFLISRQISYERTVDEFMLQLAANEALRPLRGRREMVVLLNEEGALVQEHGTWQLYFTPNRSERRTVGEGEELYAVYRAMLARFEAGEISCVPVPGRSLKALLSGRNPFCILDEFCKAQPGGYLAVAQRLVLEGPEFLFRYVPVCRYRALSTVDLNEVESYHAIKSLMDDYIYSYDQGREGEHLKPLSIAVFGPPGAGKSFGVKQIALSRARFHISALNLSQIQTPGELFSALHRALRYDEGKIPLIFFDEFDSEWEGIARGWLKYFLAPMQDGEYALNGEILPIPGAVFVFGGATAASFGGFLPVGEEGKQEFQAIKGPDFISRLKGILNVKGPNPTSVTDKRHIIRRAMLLREHLVQNTPMLFRPETGRVEISPSLLSALLRVCEFRHGARSMEFILAMSRLAEASRFTPSCLPLAEQLDLHLDVKDFMQKLSFQQMMGDVVEDYARIAHEGIRSQAHDENDESVVPWGELKEIYKESYRSQIRFLGEQMGEGTFNVGLRPILPGANDAICELYGPILEQLAGLEHARWMRDKEMDGWVQGEYDVELKHHPEMVPYVELDERVKEFIRWNVRRIPGNLREVGYELYRKIL